MERNMFLSKKGEELKWKETEKNILKNIIEKIELK